MNISYELVKDLVQSIGFPVFVAIYLLIEFRRTIIAVEESIKANTEVLSKLAIRIEEVCVRLEHRNE